MLIKPACTAAMLLSLSVACAADPAPAGPTVRIFCGAPGDAAHHDAFTGLLKRLRTVFQERYALPPEQVRIWYGPQSAGYAGVCDRDALLKELAAAAAGRAAGAPQWLLFIGHANQAAGQARYNLPGGDVTAAEMAAALKGDGNAPMAIFCTTAIGGQFLKPLAGPGRIILAATGTDEPENETFFPVCLADALEAPDTDADANHQISAAELFLAAKRRVMAAYETEKLIQRENPILDGDGDGRGTGRPARSDVVAAEALSLPLSRRQEILDKFD